MCAAPLRPEDVCVWRNIPQVLRDALLKISDHAGKLAESVDALSTAVGKKASASEVADVAARCVGVEQFRDLAQFVQRDLVSRLDQPCAGHTTASRTLAQLISRVGQLESVVAAQDKMIQHLQQEMPLRVSRSDLDAEGLASRSFVETSVAAATRGLASVAYVETSLAGKAEAAAISAIVSDLHTLNAELQSRPTKDETTTLVEAKASAAAASARTAAQHTMDTAMRSVAELRRAIDAKAGKDETPGAWRAKVASLTAAFDTKLTSMRSEVLKEAQEEFERQLAEVVEALNKKAYKSDVLRALSSKVGTEDLHAAINKKADATAVEDGLRRKADVTELATIRRAVVDLAQSVLVSRGPDLGGAAAQSAAGRILEGLRAGSGLDTADPLSTLTATGGKRAPLMSHHMHSESAVSGDSSSTRADAASMADLRGEIAALRLQVEREAGRVDALRRELQHAVVSGARATQGATPAIPGDKDRPAAAPATAEHRKLWDEYEKLAIQIAAKVDVKEFLPIRDAVSNAAAKAGAVTHEVGVLAAEVQALREAHTTLSAELDAVAGKSSMMSSPGKLSRSMVAPPAGAPTSILGKWLWKSRRLDDETSSIMWDVQGVNTAPDVFIWHSPDDSLTEDDPDAACCTVRVVAGGLYRLQLAVFAAVLPAITVVVNGDAAVSTMPAEPVPNADDSAETSSGAPRAVLVGSTIVHAHPTGSVAGLTLMQYLALPPHAALRILHSGDVRGQGVLEIEKVFA